MHPVHPGCLCKQQVVPGQRLPFHSEQGVFLLVGGGEGDLIGVNVKQGDSFHKAAWRGLCAPRAGLGMSRALGLSACTLSSQLSGEAGEQGGEEGGFWSQTACL